MKTRLHELRLEKGLTTRKLAEYVGYHFSTIAGIESERREPSPESLICFCDYFHCSVDYFLYRTDVKDYTNGTQIKSESMQVAYDFEKLTPTQQAIIKNMIKEFKK